MKPTVELDFTPNPDTLKYSVLGKTLVDRGVYSFKSQAEAEGVSDIAKRILMFGGVAQVMIAKSYITVTRDPKTEWDDLHTHVMTQMQEFVEKDEPAYTGELAAILETSALGETEQKIVAVLEEIRPFVAKDGGDIQFERYEGGVVYLTLHGSCQGCPSSVLTLKNGIETKLKEVLPEIKEVVSV